MDSTLILIILGASLLISILCGLISFVIIVKAGRKEKAKFLPITKVDMDKEQLDYVMKKLDFQKNFSTPALHFYVALSNNKLQEEDLPLLNEYMNMSGLYIGKYKLY